MHKHTYTHIHAHTHVPRFTVGGKDQHMKGLACIHVWLWFYILCKSLGRVLHFPKQHTETHTEKEGEKNAQEENDHVTVWMAPPCFCKVDVKIGEFHLHLRHVESAARWWGGCFDQKVTHEETFP